LKLATPYPPTYKWIVESKTIADLWQEHIEESKQPDKRHKRHPIFMLDEEKLQYDVESNEDVLIYDKETEELVMVILRGFTGHPELLSYLEQVVKANVEHQKNLQVCFIFNSISFLSYSLHNFQLADPGKLVQAGVSAGAHSKPSLDWVRNITSNRLSDDFVDDLDQKTAHAFSLFWMLIR
jgi:hypothetical protein